MTHFNKLIPFFLILVLGINTLILVFNFNDIIMREIFGVGVGGLQGDPDLESSNGEISPLMNSTLNYNNPDASNSPVIHPSYSLPQCGGLEFNYRKNITIHASQVDEDLQNFPVFIELIDEDDIFSTTQPTGNDIIFTDNLGNKLNHEIELFDTTTSHFNAWVSVNLSSSTDTIISLYYGNDTVSNQQNPSGVWDSNYMAVWHLNENPAEETQIYDSTNNDNDGTIYGSMTAENQKEGQMGYSIYLDGSDDYFLVPHSESLDLTGSQMTLEGWIYLPYTPIPEDSAILTKGDDSEYPSYMMGVDGDSSPSLFDQRLTTTGGYDRTDNGDIYPGRWTYLAAVYDGNLPSDPRFFGYINGVEANAEYISGTIIQSSEDLYIGRRGATDARMLIGKLDELRISDNARSVGYITTSYNNQHYPNSFYSVGSQEPYKNEFRYLKKITINALKVSGSTDLMNFPLLIDLYDSDLNNTEKVKADGSNLVFINLETDRELAFEIETFEQNYDSTKAHLVAWVKIDRLSASKNTHIGLFYGNDVLLGNMNASSVWENYLGIWHLGEIVSDEGSELSVHIDSSSNSNNGNQHGNNYSIGLIGYGQDFDGLNDYIEMGDASSLDMYDETQDQSYTLSGWFYRDSTSNKEVILEKLELDPEGDGLGYSVWIGSNGYLYFRVADNDDDGYQIRSTSNFNVLPTGWYHFAITCDTGIDENNWRLFINGIDDNGVKSLYGAGQNFANINVLQNDASFTIGAHSNTTYPFDGKIDEIRFMSSLLSEDWISTEFENQNNTNEFYTISDEIENDNWWRNISFNYRKDIKIDHQSFSGTEEELILRPGANGYTNSFYRSGAAINFQAVDEIESDGTSSYIYNDLYDSYLTDYYHPIGPSKTIDGTISKVTVYSRAGTANSDIISLRYQNRIRVEGVEYSGTTRYSISISSFTTYSDEWTLNPATGQPWTWDDIQNLQIGVRGRISYDNYYIKNRIRITQVYASVTYISNKCLYNYPLLLDINSSDLKTNAQSDGDDIVFYDYVGRKLSYELMLYNYSYSLTHARLLAWIKIPRLSTTDDTMISMFYGNSTIGSQASQENTWSKDYQAVYHMEEPPSDSVLDSTKNNFDLTQSGSMNSDDLVPGQVVNATDFDGSDDQLYTDQTVTLQDFTIFAWIKFDLGTSWRGILNIDRGIGNCLEFAILNNQPAFYDGATTTFETNLLSSTWYHIVYTYDSSLDELKCFINGMQCGDTAFLSISSVTDDFQIGAWDSSDWFDGIIDEVRIMNTSVSASLIKIDYINQFDSSALFTSGIEVERPGIEVVDFGVNDLGDGNPTYWAVFNEYIVGVSSVTIAINKTQHSMVKNSSGIWTYQPSTVNFGDFYNYTIINATDVMGRYLTEFPSIKTHIFDYDTKAPILISADKYYSYNWGADGEFRVNISNSWGVAIDTVIVNATKVPPAPASYVWAYLKNYIQIDTKTYGFVNSTLDESPSLSDMINYTIFVNDTAGNSYLSPIYIGFIYSNSKPTASNLIYSPQPLYSNSTLTLSYTWTDPELGSNEPPGVSKIRWYCDSGSGFELQPIHNDSKTIGSEYLFKGHVWYANVTPSDGQDFGDEVGGSTNNITVINTPPKVEALSWNKTEYYTTDDLGFNFEFVDDDPSDTEDTENRIVEWYLNGAHLSEVDNDTEIPSTFTSKGQNYSIIIRVFDGTNYSGYYKISYNITILNSVPQALDVNLDTTTLNPAYTNETLNATWLFYDADSGDEENSTLTIIQWFKNGLYRSEFNNNKTISSINTTRGDVWWFTLEISDNFNYSTIYKSNPLVILNSPPYISNIQFNSGAANIYTTDDLEVSWIFGDQDEFDLQFNYTTKWYLNNQYIALFDNINEIPSLNTTKGQEWNVSITVQDNGGAWSLMYNSSTITIVNSLPSVTIQPENHPEFVVEDEPLVILSNYYTFHDNDQDNDTSLIQWYKDTVLQPQFENKSVPFDATSPGEMWQYRITPFDGEDTGDIQISPIIYIETRPTINSYQFFAMNDTEGHYKIELNITDSRNDIKQVEFYLYLNSTKAVPASIITSPETDRPNIWVLDDYLTDYSYLGTLTIVNVIVITEVDYSITYEIELYKSYNFTMMDVAPPRVINAWFEKDNDRNPTTLTFFAEIDEKGSGISEITLFYYFSPIENGGEGASIFQQEKSVFMTFERMSADYYLYSITVDIGSYNTDLEIKYHISTTDNDGNINGLAFDNSNLPEQRILYTTPGLPEWLVIVGVLIIFIIFIGSVVYVKFIRKPEIRGLDKELVLEGVKEITDTKIMNSLDAHTIGIVVSFFDQRHGPVPIITIPDILKDNWAKLVELSDRSFSGTQFSDEYDIETVSNYDFILDRGLRVSVMSFGFALERLEARGGQENITENILIHKDVFPLLNQFQEEIQTLIHKTHVLMDKESSEKEKIRDSVFKLRKYITAIVLSYQSIYGTIELLEEEDK